MIGERSRLLNARRNHILASAFFLIFAHISVSFACYERIHFGLPLHVALVIPMSSMLASDSQSRGQGVSILGFCFCLPSQRGRSSKSYSGKRRNRISCEGTPDCHGCRERDRKRETRSCCCHLQATVACLQTKDQQHM